MMSAAAMSAAIRAKKKKMEMDESGAVKLSGIPEDAIDAKVIEDHIPGEALSENTPTEGSTMLPEDVHEQEDPKQVNQPADGPVERRKANARKMLARMGK